MGPNYGWIELVFFYGIAIGFGLWQVWKTNRELVRTRAKRAEREAAEAKRDQAGAERPAE
jgi:ABC-type nickel/cobalt efflux system permease component RcnA